MPQRFKLLRGKHVQADTSKEPLTAFNEETGEDEPIRVRGPGGRSSPKYPSRMFEKGEEFDSTVDLVKKFGPEKFAYVDEPRKGRRSPGLAGENEEVVEASEKTPEDFTDRAQT